MLSALWNIDLACELFGVFVPSSAVSLVGRRVGVFVPSPAVSLAEECLFPLRLSL